MNPYNCAFYCICFCRNTQTHLQLMTQKSESLSYEYCQSLWFTLQLLWFLINDGVQLKNDANATSSPLWINDLWKRNKSLQELGFCFAVSHNSDVISVLLAVFGAFGDSHTVSFVESNLWINIMNGESYLTRNIEAAWEL